MEKNCLTGTAGPKSRCEAVSDILIVNQLNEKQFITHDERTRITMSAKSFGSAYAKALSQKYALLTTEFLLLSKEDCKDSDPVCLARQLDEYCLQHSDVKNLPWQACVSAIVWEINHV